MPTTAIFATSARPSPPSSLASLRHRPHPPTSVGRSSTPSSPISPPSRGGRDNAPTAANDVHLLEQAPRSPRACHALSDAAASVSGNRKNWDGGLRAAHGREPLHGRGGFQSRRKGMRRGRGRGCAMSGRVDTRGTAPREDDSAGGTRRWRRYNQPVVLLPDRRELEPHGHSGAVRGVVVAFVQLCAATHGVALLLGLSVHRLSGRRGLCAANPEAVFVIRANTRAVADARVLLIWLF